MLLAGCVLDRPPGPKYCEKLRFAELDLREPLPRPGTLRKWRSTQPDDLQLALRAPRHALESAAGPLRLTPECQRTLGWTLDSADALAAKWVVLQTPASLTPGGRSRELLRALAESLPRTADRHFVWVYSGAWEAEEAHALASELGLLCAFDPLEADRPPGPLAYARLRALGHRRSFTDAGLQDAIDCVATDGATALGVFSVDSDRAYPTATRLQALIDAGLADD